MKFIFFGNDWLADNRTSSHHIAKRLATRYPVLYVEVPGLKAPGASTRDLGKIIEKLRMTFQPPQLVAPHFWRMTLPQIPFRRNASLRAINRWLSRLLMRRAMRNFDFRHAIAWFHLPHPGFLAKQLDEQLTVFYCIDDYSNLPDVDSNAIQQMDDKLTAAADIVFAANQSLMDTHRIRDRNVFLSPHGVDAEMFTPSTTSGAKIPEEANRLQRPVIGWWGVIDSRVDVRLLKELALARPDWTILLIGRVATDVSVLRRLPNIVFAGPKPYAELPAWANTIDVCILPYSQSPWLCHASPFKLREYLSAGKPVVSTLFPEARIFASLVHVAADGPRFVHAIEESLAADSAELATLRRKAVGADTWDATVFHALEKVEAEIQSFPRS